MSRSICSIPFVSLLLLQPFGAAVSTAAAPPGPSGPERIARLVRQLGADAFAERETAAGQLWLIGLHALPALRLGCADQDPEIRERSNVVMRRIDGDAMALRDKGAKVQVDGRFQDGRIYYVNADGLWFDDEDLRRVGRMSQIQCIRFENAAITDAGLAALSALPSLTRLEFSGCKISGRGLLRLKNSTRMSILDLSDTRIVDEDLAQFQAFPELMVLWLKHLPIGDRGIAHLRRNKQLMSLSLEDTRLTNEGLKHVGKFGKLRYLWLHQTAVTDEGLKHLEGLTDLRFVDVSNTRVTEKAFEAFKRKMPNYGKE